MSPWAIEEVFLRPAATLVACALLPIASAAVLRRILGGGAGLRAASRIVRAAEIGMATLAGLTALGPALLDRPRGWESVAFALACALVALGAGAVARRRSPPSAAEHGARLGIAVGLVTASTLIALVLAPWAVTRIAPSDATRASESAARWRLRVDPWDPAAMLASGWAARRRDAYARALAWAEAAREHGASEAAALELEAEVLAARGQCERARARFDEALRARTEAAFADPLAAPLELGGYHLPPSLLTECE